MVAPAWISVSSTTASGSSQLSSDTRRFPVWCAIAIIRAVTVSSGSSYNCRPMSAATDVSEPEQMVFTCARQPAARAVAAASLLPSLHRMLGSDPKGMMAQLVEPVGVSEKL